MARPIDAEKAKFFIADVLDIFHVPIGDRMATMLIDTIDKLPTVDAVEVVHGHWLMRGGRRYCSACGEMACVTRDRDDFWYTVGTKYCPECGTKMDGDRNV